MPQRGVRRRKPVYTGEGRAVPASFRLPGVPQMSEFAVAYPSSRKVLVDAARGVQVPMREVALSGGEPPLRLYDTSGPQDVGVANGLPKLRTSWVEPRRRAAARGGPLPQKGLARRGGPTGEQGLI